MPAPSTNESPPAQPAQPADLTELSVNGMTCSNCVRHVTDAIQSVPGVRSAVVSLEAQHAKIRWSNTAAPDVPAVIRAIESEGYGAKLADAHMHEHEHAGHGLAGWKLNLWIGAIGTGTLMIGEWILNFGPRPWFQWFSFAIAAVVQIVAGAPFYRGAWNQLKVGSSNMDTLVALGSSTAFAYSTWALLARLGGHLYFMEAAAIITLISIGHWLESRAGARASSALRQLLNLAPQKARKLVRNAASAQSNEIEISVSELAISDHIVLRPGDRVPTDGIIVEGESAVDEGMLTGESVPVDKSPGREVYAGTTVSNGRLVVRVTATGEETALAHVIAAVQRAQTSRANIQRLADRVSSVFVPIVVAIALVSALWWGLAFDSAVRAHSWLGQFLWHTHLPATAVAAAFIIPAAVLIIACPCAMGLATPAAIMTGSNVAARRGILIRDGVALEKAGNVTAVLFDKTGTLTVGKPEVAAVWENSRFQIPGSKLETADTKHETRNSKLAALAATLARHSTHPISQAIARISDEQLEIADWKEIRGAGVQGKVESRPQGSTPENWLSAIGYRLSAPIRLGSLRWLKDSGVDLSPGQPFINEHSAKSATLVGLAADNSLLALFAVKDVIKSGAPNVVERLRGQGLKIYLVTGDNAVTAAAIAKQVGIDTANVFAEVRPEQKADFVTKLQQQGERVAFVGDGINDAPALEQADLGIAVSRASDIAREAADMILLRSDIEAVPESLGLARATLRTIKQNLFWAFFYNAIGVPLAALGFMSPILCAAAMGVSDFIVIGNALRLARWRGGVSP